MNEIATGKDADFSEGHVVSTYNAYLANSIGNLLSRILSLGQHVKDHRLRRIRKHSTKIFKAIFSAQTGKKLRTEEVDFKKETNERLIPSYTRAMNQSLPSAAMKEINDYATLCNQLIDKWKPWELAKDDSKCEQFDAVFYIVSEALRNIAILISPVLPRAAHGIFDQLNWKMELSGKQERFSLADAEWGKLPDGHVVGKPTPLFPRIEV
jgi:methionyl-tRNA synthetase